MPPPVVDPLGSRWSPSSASPRPRDAAPFAPSRLVAYPPRPARRHGRAPPPRPPTVGAGGPLPGRPPPARSRPTVGPCCCWCYSLLTTNLIYVDLLLLMLLQAVGLMFDVQYPLSKSSYSGKGT